MKENKWDFYLKSGSGLILYLETDESLNLFWPQFPEL